MPWPANAASPCSSTASATDGSCAPFGVERSVCSARVRPSTTGSTASRWLGLATRRTPTLPFAVVRVPCAARWYLTSPVPPSGSAVTASIVRSPSNSRRMYSYGIPIVCASTLRRPRCAIPITTSCAPPSEASSIVSSSIGIITSSPSSENCFCPRNRLRRKRSIPSTSQRRRKSARRCSSGNGCRYAPDSIACRSQTRCWWSDRCSIS